MCHNDRSQGRIDILNDLFCFPFDTAVLVLRLESFLEISLADTQWSWRGWTSRPGWFEIPACLNMFHKFVSTWNWMAGIWRIDQWIWGIHHVYACWTNRRNQWLFIHAKKWYNHWWLKLLSEPQENRWMETLLVLGSEMLSIQRELRSDHTFISSTMCTVITSWFWQVT